MQLFNAKESKTGRCNVYFNKAHSSGSGQCVVTIYQILVIFAQNRPFEDTYGKLSEAIRQAHCCKERVVRREPGRDRGAAGAEWCGKIHFTENPESNH